MTLGGKSSRFREIDVIFSQMTLFESNFKLDCLQEGGSAN